MGSAKMGLLIVGMLAIVPVGTWAQEASKADPLMATTDALRAEIESLREVNVAWRKVAWRTCLLDAFKESAREKKPVFLWVLGGSPSTGRC